MRVHSFCVAMVGMLALGFSTLLLADNDRREGERRGPPEEAFAACDGKTEGDTVSFSTPRHENLSGTCKMMRERLVAVPDHGAEGHAHGGREGKQSLSE